MEVMSPGLQGTDNCEELLVIDVIVLFCWNEQLEEVGVGIPIAIGIGLEDGTGGVFGGIGGNGRGLGNVWEVKDRA